MARSFARNPQLHVVEMGSDQEKAPMLSTEMQEPGHVNQEAFSMA